jgi:hypothetical protein
MHIAGLPLSMGRYILSEVFFGSLDRRLFSAGLAFVYLRNTNQTLDEFRLG